MTENEAIWWSAVMLAYERWQAGELNEAEDAALVQAVIRKRAEALLGHPVQASRISQTVNADHPDGTYRYVRHMPDQGRRVTYPGEFGGALERPDVFEEESFTGADGTVYRIETLLDFLDGPYRALFRRSSVRDVFDTLADRIPMERGEAAFHEVATELASEEGLVVKRGTSPLSSFFTGWHDAPHARLQWVADRDDSGSQLRLVLALERTTDGPYGGPLNFVTQFAMLDERSRWTIFVDETMYDPSDREALVNAQERIDRGAFDRLCIVYELTEREAMERAIPNDALFDALRTAVGYLADWYALLVEGARLHTDQNVILHGPPGTGKTYDAIRMAVALVEKKAFRDVTPDDERSIFERYRSYVDEGMVEFVTFHANVGYEEWMEGIRPTLETSDVSYRVVDGPMKQLCARAKALPHERFVMIIDELNRANVTSVFGELLTVLEPTKRLGAKEALTVRLPHSGESFGVPQNVYVIGTMNTSDRTLAPLDDAFRRRFRFISREPNVSLLKEVTVGSIDVYRLVSTMNERLFALGGKEAVIGHAYFTELIDDPSLERLAHLFKTAVVPALFETFAFDESLVRLVLADGAKLTQHQFVTVYTPPEDLFFGADVPLLDERYVVQPDAFYDEASYVGVYERV